MCPSLKLARQADRLRIVVDVALAESLMALHDWPSEWFLYNGPNAPYVRIGYHFLFQRSVFSPLPWLERWHHDVPINQHLSLFDGIMISGHAYAEIAGCHWLPDDFPFDRWLRFHVGVLRKGDCGSTEFACSHGVHRLLVDELGALCLGDGVRLRGVL